MESGGAIIGDVNISGGEVIREGGANPANPATIHGWFENDGTVNVQTSELAQLKVIKINGQHAIAVHGEIGETYHVEVSNDLDQWLPLT